MKANRPTDPTLEPDEIDPALDPTLDQLSRRTFLGRAGAASALAAVLSPAEAQEAAQKIRALDDEHLDRKMIAFPSKSSDGKKADIKAFLAVPSPASNVRRKPYGAVLVVHEIFGLTDHIKDVACRLAQAGYIALAPNLFTREGDPPPMSGGFGPLMQFVGKIPDRQILGDLSAASDFLRARRDTNKKVGIVGFCWGGRVSMLAAAEVPHLNAAVAYYGRISGEKSATQPAHPIDLVEQMRAPLLGHFGEKDGGIPPAEANKLKAALADHKKTGEIYVYEGAGHAFNNDTRESYHAPSARLAWDRTLAWFEKYVQG